MSTVRIMISMPEALLAEIDRAAELEHRSRSGFLREAAREYMARQERSGVSGGEPEIRVTREELLELARRTSLEGGAELRDLPR